MTVDKPKRGGPNRGQGRKPLAMDGQTVRINITMTAEQRDKLKKLGGSAWVRQQIEAEQTDQLLPDRIKAAVLW